MNRTVLIAAVAAFLLKASLAFLTYGTNDVLFYEGYLKTIKNKGPLAVYELGAQLERDGITYHSEPFWTPPFIINYLLGLDLVSSATGFPMRVWLRLVSSLADFVTLFLLLRMHPAGKPVGLLIALAPVSILVSGFHGSTDSVMLAFLMASVYFAARPGGSDISGVLYGLCCAVKVWPAIFLPCFILSFPQWRVRTRFALLAAATWSVVSLPYLAQRPLFIVNRILSYQSVDMAWGVRFMAKLLNPNLNQFVGRYGAVITFAVIAILSVFFAKRQAKLHLQIAVVSLFFVFFSPGFGYQYLIWLTPAMPLLFAWELVIWHLVSGYYLIYIYSYFLDANRLANVLAKSPSLTLILLAVPVWFFVGYWLIVASLRVRRRCKAKGP